VGDILRLIRIRHWIKNVFVFAPLVFSLHVFTPGSLGRTLIVFDAFCLVSSGVYAFNDITDRRRDRLHPEKKNRPLASGAVSVKTALFISLFCAVSGTALAAFLGIPTLIILLTYLAANVLYSLVLKQQSFIDVMVIALGFLLRVGAGAVAIHVEISQWMLLTTFFLSLFLGFGKRRKEATVTEQAAEYRGVFRDYSVELLNYLIIISATLTIITYSLYVVTSRNMEDLGNGRFFITIPFVVFGIFRYMLLIYRGQMGGDPADVVLKDRAMILDILLWGATILILLGINLLAEGR